MYSTRFMHNNWTAIPILVCYPATSPSTCSRLPLVCLSLTCSAPCLSLRRTSCWLLLMPSLKMTSSSFSSPSFLHLLHGQFLPLDHHLSYCELLLLALLPWKIPSWDQNSNFSIFSAQSLAGCSAFISRSEIIEEHSLHCIRYRIFSSIHDNAHVWTGSGSQHTEIRIWIHRAQEPPPTVEEI